MTAHDSTLRSKADESRVQNIIYTASSILKTCPTSKINKIVQVRLKKIYSKKKNTTKDLIHFIYWLDYFIYFHYWDLPKCSYYTHTTQTCFCPTYIYNVIMGENRSIKFYSRPNGIYFMRKQGAAGSRKRELLLLMENVRKTAPMFFFNLHVLIISYLQP